MSAMNICANAPFSCIIMLIEALGLFYGKNLISLFLCIL